MLFCFLSEYKPGKITRSEIINACNYKTEDKYDNEELDYTRDVEST